MRKRFEQLMRTYRQFLRQRDMLILLIPCSDNDAPLVLKALRDLDRETGTDVFLLFADAFQNSPDYLNRMANQLEREHTETNAATGDGMEKLSPLPMGFLDQTSPPMSRLTAAFAYSRSLVDPQLGQHHVWGMIPLQIGNAEAYLKLLSELPPNPEIRPWMRGARLIARVPADFQLAWSPLAYARRVQVECFSIPPDAQEEELQSTAGDPKVPLGDRMRAEVQLGYLDYAHSRFDQGSQRFLKALAFFQWAEIPAMEGLVICGLGDIARRQGNWPEAQHWYACAVTPAAKAGNPILLATIVQNLAVVAFQEGRFADAEQRYSELVTLKRGMIDEVGLAEALEWQGLSQEKQWAYDRAVVAWEESALIAKAFEMKDRLPPLLVHLKRGYRALNMREELETFDAEWAAGE
jgi:tetratricopeptide (TPR) repeat protein